MKGFKSPGKLADQKMKSKALPPTHSKIVFWPTYTGMESPKQPPYSIGLMTPTGPARR